MTTLILCCHDLIVLGVSDVILSLANHRVLLLLCWCPTYIRSYQHSSCGWCIHAYIPALLILLPRALLACAFRFGVDALSVAPYFYFLTFFLFFLYCCLAAVFCPRFVPGLRENMGSKRSTSRFPPNHNKIKIMERHSSSRTTSATPPSSTSPDTPSPSRSSTSR